MAVAGDLLVTMASSPRVPTGLCIPEAEKHVGSSPWRRLCHSMNLVVLVTAFTSFGVPNPPPVSSLHPQSYRGPAVAKVFLRGQTTEADSDSQMYLDQYGWDTIHTLPQYFYPPFTIGIVTPATNPDGTMTVMGTRVGAQTNPPTEGTLLPDDCSIM